MVRHARRRVQRSILEDIELRAVVRGDDLAGLDRKIQRQIARYLRPDNSSGRNGSYWLMIVTSCAFVVAALVYVDQNTSLPVSYWVWTPLGGLAGGLAAYADQRRVTLANRRHGLTE